MIKILEMVIDQYYIYRINILVGVAIFFLCIIIGGFYYCKENRRYIANKLLQNTIYTIIFIVIGTLLYLLEVTAPIEYGKYQEYTTIYRRMDDGSIILSNDGRVWTPPPPPEPAPDPEPPTLEEVRAKKRQEISTTCEQIIYSGVTVMLPSGSEHFSLTEKDQLNLLRKRDQIVSGVEQLEYHQDGHPFRYYTVDEMQNIIATAMEHVSYHTVYCNSLNMWIAGTESINEVQEIYYGANIPEKYQSKVLKDHLLRMMNQAGIP